MNDKPTNTAVKFILLNEARRLAMTKRRVRNCHRLLAWNKDSAEIRRASGRAWWANLQTCGSVWDCAVCSSRITEARAAELDTAVGRWSASGGYVYMATYTLSHGKGQPLEAVMKILTAAYRAFHAGKGYQSLKQRGGFQYSVRALEITHGANGWHPHIHELIFADPVGNDALRAAERDGAVRWVKMLEKHGGSGLLDIAYNFTQGDMKVAEYINKYGKLPEGETWTLGREMGKAPSKRAAKDGRTAFGLLMDSANGDEAASKLWKEYHNVTFRRQQLVWSSGLREALGMDPAKSDDELANEQQPEYSVFAAFTAEGLRKIVNLPRDVRADLLRIAADEDMTEFWELIGYAGLTPGDIVSVG